MYGQVFTKAYTERDMYSVGVEWKECGLVSEHLPFLLPY